MSLRQQHGELFHGGGGYLKEGGEALKECRLKGGKEACTWKM